MFVNEFEEKLRTFSSRTSTFRRMALSPDIFPRVNTIMPSDQFKPVRLGKVLVVNYHD